MRDPGGAPQQNFFEFGYENIFKVLKILSWEIKKNRCTSSWGPQQNLLKFGNENNSSFKDFILSKNRRHQK